MKFIEETLIPLLILITVLTLLVLAFSSMRSCSLEEARLRCISLAEDPGSCK